MTSWAEGSVRWAGTRHLLLLLPPVCTDRVKQVELQQTISEVFTFEEKAPTRTYMLTNPMFSLVFLAAKVVRALSVVVKTSAKVLLQL